MGLTITVDIGGLKVAARVVNEDDPPAQPRCLPRGPSSPSPEGIRPRSSAADGGSAPRRVQVSAVTRTASSSTAASVPRSTVARSACRWAPSRCRRCRPARRPLVKASPAPTVSTTATGRPGRWTIPSAEAATTPPGPSVTTTIAGPRVRHAVATCTGGCPGRSQARSSALALTISAAATSASTRGRSLSGVPISWGRQFGS